ncbi:MAG: hypothetical protein ABSB75_06370 [Candidatus Limnocylindrales bacterium]
MPRKWLAVVGLALLLTAAGAFVVGYRIGGDRAIHITIYTGDGRTSDDMASLQVGDRFYAFRSNVAWTDSTGSFHEDGWPECLPKGSDVKNVRFAAAVLWVGDVGISPILWVDCRQQ